MALPLKMLRGQWGHLGNVNAYLNMSITEIKFTYLLHTGKQILIDKSPLKEIHVLLLHKSHGRHSFEEECCQQKHI